MGTAKQLYQLQEVDLELEANEQALKQIVSQLGESQDVLETRNKLAQERQRLEEWGREQHSLEWEIEDISTKLTAAGEKLYSGRIHNPKELTNLQQETNQLRNKRNQLEDKVLGIMEQIELKRKTVTHLDNELKVLETEWRSRQQQLTANLEQLKNKLSNLRQKRQLLTTEIAPEVIDTYQELKKQKRTAVAKVEQGVCGGCRILLPVTELQRIKGDNLVRCSSCGRLLFLA